MLEVPSQLSVLAKPLLIVLEPLQAQAVTDKRDLLSIHRMSVVLQSFLTCS